MCPVSSCTRPSHESQEIIISYWFDVWEDLWYWSVVVGRVMVPALGKWAKSFNGVSLWIQVSMAWNVLFIHLPCQMVGLEFWDCQGELPSSFCIFLWLCFGAESLVYYLSVLFYVNYIKPLLLFETSPLFATSTPHPAWILHSIWESLYTQRKSQGKKKGLIAPLCPDLKNFRGRVLGDVR
jgi:hypothetical protein